MHNIQRTFGRGRHSLISRITFLFLCILPLTLAGTWGPFSIAGDASQTPLPAKEKNLPSSVSFDFSDAAHRIPILDSELGIELSLNITTSAAVKESEDCTLAVCVTINAPMHVIPLKFWDLSCVAYVTAAYKTNSSVTTRIYPRPGPAWITVGMSSRTCKFNIDLRQATTCDGGYFGPGCKLAVATLPLPEEGITLQPGASLLFRAAPEGISISRLFANVTATGPIILASAENTAPSLTLDRGYDSYNVSVKTPWGIHHVTNDITSPRYRNSEKKNDDSPEAIQLRLARYFLVTNRNLTDTVTITFAERWTNPCTRSHQGPNCMWSVPRYNTTQVTRLSCCGSYYMSWYYGYFYPNNATDGSLKWSIGVMAQDKTDIYPEVYLRRGNVPVLPAASLMATTLDLISTSSSSSSSSPSQDASNRDSSSSSGVMSSFLKALTPDSSFLEKVIDLGWSTFNTHDSKLEYGATPNIFGSPSHIESVSSSWPAVMTSPSSSSSSSSMMTMLDEPVSSSEMIFDVRMSESTTMARYFQSSIEQNDDIPWYFAIRVHQASRIGIWFQDQCAGNCSNHGPCGVPTDPHRCGCNPGYQLWMDCSVPDLTPIIHPPENRFWTKPWFIVCMVIAGVLFFALTGYAIIVIRRRRRTSALYKVPDPSETSARNEYLSHEVARYSAFRNSSSSSSAPSSSSSFANSNAGAYVRIYGSTTPSPSNAHGSSNGVSSSGVLSVVGSSSGPVDIVSRGGSNVPSSPSPRANATSLLSPPSSTSTSSSSTSLLPSAAGSNQKRGKAGGVLDSVREDESDYDRFHVGTL